MEAVAFLRKVILEGKLIPENRLLDYARWLAPNGFGGLARIIYDHLTESGVGDFRTHSRFLASESETPPPAKNYLGFIPPSDLFSPCNRRVVAASGLDQAQGLVRRIWSHEFPRTLDRAVLPDVPLPVIYGDNVIVFSPDSGGRPAQFVCLDLATGASRWEWRPAERLDYFATPILFNGLLYSFCDGALRVKAIGENRVFFLLYENADFHPGPFMLPLLVRFQAPGTASVADYCYLVLPNKCRLHILEMPHGKKIFDVQVLDDEQDEIRGIEHDEHWLLVTSFKGKVLKLDITTGQCETVADLQGVTTPPWRADKYIYFEFMAGNSQRGVAALTLSRTDERVLLKKSYQGESGCLANHGHWFYPIAPAQWGGVLTLSHLYHGATGFVVRSERSHDNLVTASVRLMQQGNIDLMHAGVLGHFLLVADGQEVSCFNLEQGRQSASVDVGSTLIGGPVFCGNRCVVLACDGAVCLEIH